MSKHDFKPPYVLIAAFCETNPSPAPVTSISPIIRGISAELDGPANAVAIAVPLLYVEIATPGLSGRYTLTVDHRPPGGEALPPLEFSHEHRGDVASVRFEREGAWLFFRGLHMFDLSYNGRLMTRIPFRVSIKSSVLKN